MKSQGFLQTPQEIIEEYNGCSVPQYTGYPLLRKSRDGVPMRLVMETVGKVMQGIGLYLKSQFTEHGRDTMSALR